MRHVCGIQSGPRIASKMSLGLLRLEERHLAALKELPEVLEEGVIEDDTHADTCYLGKGWRVVTEHDYTTEVSGFTDGIGSVNLPVVDALGVATTKDGREVILRINQALYQEGEDRSLLSTFQARWSGTRVDNVPVSQDPTSEFGIVLHSEEDGREIVPFSMRGTSIGFKVRRPLDEDLESLPIFDVTSSLHWDPNSPEHAEEERRAQAQRDFTAKDRVFLTNEVPREGEVRRVNLSAMWTKSTDAMLIEAMEALDDDDVYAPSETSSVAGSDNSAYSGGSAEEDQEGTGCGEKPVRYLKSVETVKSQVESAKKKLQKIRLSKLKVTKQSLKVKNVKSTSRKPRVSAERLAKMWGIGLERAKATVQATTQNAVRDVTKPLTRRFRSRPQVSRRNRFRGTVYTDTMKSGKKSMRGNKFMQVLVTDFHDVTVYPLKEEKKAYTALRSYFIDRGVPEKVHSDNAFAMTRSEKWKRVLEKEGGIEATTTEPHSPFQNNAEREIGHLQSQALRGLRKAGASLRFWDDAMEWYAEIRSRTAREDDIRLEGRVPRELIEANTVDISEFCQFEWYEPVWAWMQGDNPEKGERLCRVAGVAKNVGQAMCFRLIPEQSWSPFANFQYLSRSTVRPVTDEERASESFQNKLKKLDKSIARKAGDPATVAEIEAYEAELMPYEDRVDFTSAMSRPDPMDSDHDMPDQDDAPTPEETDEYKNVQVLLPRGDGYQRALVEQRKRGVDGELIGQRHENPLLDTRGYLARFSDGTVVDVSANVVAASLLEDCDQYGNEFRMLREIIDHRSDETAVKLEDGWIRRKENRPKERRKTTKGWYLLCEWVDGTQSWEKLSNLKESYPLEIADYARGNDISDEPAFAWWVGQFLKEKRRILCKVKKRYWKRTHKFGVELPKDVDEAYGLDKKNGNRLWSDAIDKEQTNNAVAFEVLPEGASPPRGYRKIKGHMVFDVKMDGQFTRKARFCANGNMIESPPSMTYASVVSRDSVRICLTLAALNNLSIKCADVQNAYLNAKPKEKVYLIGGKEFGENEGRIIVIVRSLYGLKGSGAAWAAALRQVMRDLGFFPCKADGDVWMRAAIDTSFDGERDIGATSPSGAPIGTRYYEYVLIHTDDIMAISKRPDSIMEAIGSVYKLKEDKQTKLRWDDPDMYLGTKIRKYRDPDDDSDNYCWSMSGDHYVKSVVDDIETKLAKQDRRLNANQRSPFTTGYRPEFDTSPELDEDGVSTFQELIGCYRWAIELGRADIAVEVSLLSRHMALPRRGHLEQAYNIAAYLKLKQYSKLVMSPKPMRHKELLKSRFNTDAEWYEFYGDVKEEIPLDAPEPLGKTVEMTAWVDADHAGDKLTRRSHTGLIIFLMSAPIFWYSKRQATIESSTFGSEIVAMRTCLEFIKDLRYKLRMMGVPIDGPAAVWCDNKTVVNGASIPEAKLSKKHLGICYHAVREAAAAKIWQVGFVKGEYNIADCLTKILSGTALEKQVNKWMHRR